MLADRFIGLKAIMELQIKPHFLNAENNYSILQ